MTHRSFARPRSAFVLVAAGALLLAGCSTPSANDTTAPTDAAAPTEATPEAFPVTLTNAFGEVTIPEAPERVFALGYADLGIAAALDAPIVGAVQSFSSFAGEGDKNLPYIDPLPDDVTWVNPMQLSVEEVAAADPDLILATAAFMLDEDLYEKLSAIAPVVTYETGLYTASSDDAALRIGTALGDVEGADELIETANTAISDLREELPNIEGGTFLYGQARENVAVMLVKEENVTAGFMRDLGLIALPAVADLDGTGSVPGAIDVSLEQAALFDDADVLFMTYQSDELQEAFETNPVVAAQPIMQERYVPVGLEVATALQDPNVASIPWLLDQLRPGLELIPAS